MNIVRHPNRHRRTVVSSELQRAAELAERNEQRLIDWHARCAIHALANPRTFENHLRRAAVLRSRRLTALPV